MFAAKPFLVLPSTVAPTSAGDEAGKAVGFHCDIYRMLQHPYEIQCMSPARKKSRSAARPMYLSPL